MGSTYVQEEVGDWELQCIRTDQEEDPCTLYQLLNDQEGNPVAEVSIFRLPEGGRAEAGATVIVPLETLLTEQLRIAVDGGQGKLYPFSFCNPVGCYARIGLTASDVEAFKRGAVARLSIVPFAAPDQTVTLDLSLSGFTAGYDKVSVLQN
jgi:invasion protein IalB